MSAEPIPSKIVGATFGCHSFRTPTEPDVTDSATNPLTCAIASGSTGPAGSSRPGSGVTQLGVTQLGGSVGLDFTHETARRGLSGLRIRAPPAFKGLPMNARKRRGAGQARWRSPASRPQIAACESADKRRGAPGQNDKERTETSRTFRLAAASTGCTHERMTDVLSKSAASRDRCQREAEAGIRLGARCA